MSSSAADVYLLSHKEASTRQYQSVWRKFLSFLFDNDVPHHRVSVAVVCNFLTFESSFHGLQYRTVSGYRCALRHPLYWGCGFDVNSFVSDQFLRGLFNYRPPARAAPMPVWSINVLLSYLQSAAFEPLDSVPSSFLIQKVLCLILLSSGRRISEVAHLSRDHRLDLSGPSLSLLWVPDFRPKHDSPGFQAPSPSVFFLSPSMAPDLSLCPVRAYRTFLSVSRPWVSCPSPRARHQFLWAQPVKTVPLSVAHLTNLFVKAVQSALRYAGLRPVPKIGPIRCTS